MDLSTLPGDLSPLSQRRLSDLPRLQGRIKERPEDFVVEEVPLYEPSGRGEHLYLFLQKTGLSHVELLSCLRRHFRVRENAIGYAGMKDKRAVTRQWVSIHLPGIADDPGPIDLRDDRIVVILADRHRNKLRRGHLHGNRFAIRIRGVEPTKAPALLAGLRTLERTGVPCSYGVQRFGYRRNNHLLGTMLLQRRWEEVLAELLGAGGSPFPEYQRERREHFDAGRLAEAHALWSRADRAELVALAALRRDASAERAVGAIGRTSLNFWTNSLASAIFNRVLDARIEAGTIDRLDEGDVAWKHDNRAVFTVGPEDLAAPDLEERLRRFAISPTGPLWGEGMLPAAGATAEVERDALLAFGVDEETIVTGPNRPEGARRPFRSPIAGVRAEGGMDEHGPYVGCSFELRRGMYATEVLRELVDQPEE